MLSKEEKDQLVIDHIYMAERAAKKFSKSPTKGSWDIEDLASVGKLALVKAANKFDPTNGTYFPIYARSWVEGNIIRYINEQHHILHMPYNDREDVNKIRTVFNRSTYSVNLSKSEIEQLSKTTELSLERTKKLLPYVFSETHPLIENANFVDNNLITEEPDYIVLLNEVLDSLPIKEGVNLRRAYSLGDLSKNKYYRKEQEIINTRLLKKALAKIKHPTRWLIVKKLGTSAHLLGGYPNELS